MRYYEIWDVMRCDMLWDTRCYEIWDVMPNCLSGFMINVDTDCTCEINKPNFQIQTTLHLLSLTLLGSTLRLRPGKAKCPPKSGSFNCPGKIIKWIILSTNF